MSLIKQNAGFGTGVLPQIIFLSVSSFGCVARCPSLWLFVCLFVTVLDLYAFILLVKGLTRFFHIYPEVTKAIISFVSKFVTYHF